MKQPETAFGGSRYHLALDAIARGDRVVPLLPGTDAPATPRGIFGGTLDPDQVVRWWEACPLYDVGVVRDGRIERLEVAS